MDLRVKGPVLAGLVLGLAACPADNPRASAPSGQGVRARVAREQSAPRLPVLGTKVLGGDVTELRATKDGKYLSVLRNPVKPPLEGVPPPLRVGELWVVDVQSAKASRVADGVSNMPGGWLFSPDSRFIIAAADWEQRREEGTLVVADLSALDTGVSQVAQGVKYFVTSDSGAALAFVKDGVLSVGPLPAGPFRAVAGEVSTAEFSSDEAWLYFRRRSSAAGGLHRVAWKKDGAEPQRLVDQVAEYAVLRSGEVALATSRVRPTDRAFQLNVISQKDGAVSVLASDASRFRASPDGTMVAWKTTSPEGGQTDVGELHLARLPDGKARTIGRSVKDFDFSADGTLLVFRDRYVELPLGGREAKAGEAKVEKVGDLHLVRLPDGAPKLLQRLCPNYLFSPDGKALAYTARIERPEVTRRLFLLTGDFTTPVELKDWLYEYTFRPGHGELYFRADCTREGRACDWLMVPVPAGPEEKPTAVVKGTYGVRFSGDGSGAAIAFAHLTDQTFDLALRNMQTGAQATVDQYVEWPGLFLGPTGQRYAYLVKEKQRPGVYLATVP